MIEIEVYEVYGTMEAALASGLGFYKDFLQVVYEEGGHVEFRPGCPKGLSNSRSPGDVRVVVPKGDHGQTAWWALSAHIIMATPRATGVNRDDVTETADAISFALKF